MLVEKQQLEPDMEQWTGSKLKRSMSGYILLLSLFKLYAEYIAQNTRLGESQAGIKIAGRNINNLQYADDTTLMAKSGEKLKSSLIKVKEEREETGLKLNIQKAKIMATNPSLHGKEMGKQWKQRQTFLGGSKMFANGDCSHEIERCLLLARKAMTNLDSELKARTSLC